MAKPDVSQYQSFGQISRRLDDIVGAVRDRDVSLGRSLDLFDEAIALGSKAVELVDATDFSPEEKAMLADDGAPGEKDSAKPAEKSADAAHADDAHADGADPEVPQGPAEGGNAS